MRTVLYLLQFVGMVHLALGWCYKDKLYVGDDVEQVDYSSNGDYLVIGRSDNQVDLYYTANLTKKCSYTDTVNINYIKFTPNGDAFALCRDASAVRFIKTSDCSLRGTLASGHVNVHGIDFDYTGTRILTCGDDESFKIWDYGFVRTAGGFATGQKILSCKFAYDGYIMTGDQSGSVKIYDTNYQDPPIFQRILSSGRSVLTLSFKQGTHNQYIAGADNSAYIDNKTGSLLSTTADISTAIYNKISDYFFIGSLDNKIRIYEQANHSNLEMFTQPTDCVNTGDFTDDGMQLAVGSKDQYVYFYTRCVDCWDPGNTVNSNYCPYVTNNTNLMNGTNQTTNLTNNSTTNSTNSNLTLDSLTAQEFFQQIRNNFMDSILNQYQSIKNKKISTKLHHQNQCNRFLIKVYLNQHTCSQYLLKKQYIDILNQQVKLLYISCLSDQKDNILLLHIEILSQISSSTNEIILLLIKQNYLQQNQPSFSQWYSIFQIIFVELDSLAIFQYQTLQQCSGYDRNQIYVKLLTYFSYGLLFFGIFVGKITGLQLFGIFQLSYFTLSQHRQTNHNLLPLAQLKQTNGFNILLHNENPLASKLPNNIDQISVHAYFLNNINIMLIIPVIIAGTCVFLYILSRFVCRKQDRKLAYWSLRVLCQSSITFLLFNVYNICFSLAIDQKYTSSSQQPTIFDTLNNISLTLSILLSIIVILMTEFSDIRYLGQFRSKFKASCLPYSYISLQILYRGAIGFFMAYGNQYQESILLILALPIGFTLYTVINLPFAQVVHNYRASVIRISEIVIIWVANYYRSMKANTPSFVKAHLNVPAQLELAVIGVCVIVSLLVFGYEVVYFFKGLLKNSVLNRSKKVIKDEKNETQKNQSVIQATIQYFVDQN